MTGERLHRTPAFLAAAALTAALACHPSKSEPAFFELLSPSATGVRFENRLPEDTSSAASADKKKEDGKGG